MEFTLATAVAHRAFGLGFVFLLIPSLVVGQQVSGHLIGRVTDSRSLPVTDVRVFVEGPGLPGVRSTTTGSGGAFRLSGLPVGTYRVHFQRLGYRSLTVTDVTVRLGNTTSLYLLHMDVEAVELAPLVVRGRASLIDPTSTSISTDLLASAFEHLPTERDYKSIIPGLSGVRVGDAVSR